MAVGNLTMKKCKFVFSLCFLIGAGQSLFSQDLVVTDSTYSGVSYHDKLLKIYFTVPVDWNATKNPSPDESCLGSIDLKPADWIVNKRDTLAFRNDALQTLNFAVRLCVLTGSISSNLGDEFDSS